MQTTTGTLGAAITAATERPWVVKRLLVDWDPGGTLYSNFDTSVGAWSNEANAAAPVRTVTRAAAGAGAMLLESLAAGSMSARHAPAPAATNGFPIQAGAAYHLSGTFRPLGFDLQARSGKVAHGVSDSNVATFVTAAGKDVAIEQWYESWDAVYGAGFNSTKANAVQAAGRINMISWQPWASGGGVTQPTYTLASIINGTHDAHITAWAQGLRSFGQPVMVRFAAEMNGDWNAWSEGVNGNTAGQYAQAWRHVVDLVRAQGATNAVWVWCPNRPFTGSTAMAGLYPGDGYVDWLGIDAYNFGTDAGSTWRDVPTTFNQAFSELRAINPDKPVAICETGSSENGGDKAAWITDLFARLASDYPFVRALCWFNQVGTADFRIQTSTAATNAYAAGVAASRYAASRTTAFGSSGVRTVQVGVNWYTSAGSFLSTALGTAAAELPDGWVTATATLTSPSNAARATMIVQVSSTAAAGEQHYVDEVRLSSVASEVEDLSADVVSISLSRELSTDLPAQAKLFSGSAAASATITLAHQPTEANPDQHTAWWYSPFNTSSPLYGFRRKGAPARLDVGFVTDAGVEYIRVLTGTVRSLNVTSAGRQARLEVIDGADTMRKQVTLPMIVGDGQTEEGVLLRPGLYQTWLVDWVFRRCGYYASPPARAQCKFLATMAGSAWPEIGRAVNLEGVDGAPPGFEPTSQFPGTARFLMALSSSSAGNPEYRYRLAGTGLPSVNNGSTMRVEGSYRFRTTSQDQPLWIVFKGGGAGRYVSAYWRTIDGRIDVTFNRGGGQQFAIAGPTLPGLGTTAYHDIAIHVAFASDGVRATWIVDGVTTGPTFQATTSITAQEIFDSISLDHGRVAGFADANNNLFQEAVQLTTEATIGTSSNYGFTPTVTIEPSRSQLAATPVATEEGWALIQQMAQAEFATCGFTEQGVPYYVTRDRFERGAYLTVQRVLSTTESVEELESAEAIDQVRNHIIVPVDTPTVADPHEVWRLGDPAGIASNGSRTFNVELSDPVFNLDTTVSYSGDPTVGSRYLAGSHKNGSGRQAGNLSITVAQVSATFATVTVVNPNDYPVWLTVDQDAAAQFFGTVTGNPYLVLNGQAVTFGGDGQSATRAEATHTGSVAAYGEQLLEVEANPFRQHHDSMQTLADDLLYVLHDAGPVLLDVPIVADPRLQLGDRVTIQDPTGLQVAQDFHVSKADLELDSSGMRMVVNLRAATATTATTGTGNYDEGTYDEGVYA